MRERLYRRDDPDGSVSSEHLPVPGKRTLTSHLLRRVRDDHGVAPDADAHVERAASSTGSPLPGDLRDRFEGSLGADLSAVRVHTGADSQIAADAVGARAYTVGQDIHFGAGHYDPSSAFGTHLLAHEVAHTVQQQGASPTRQHKLEVSTPGDTAEVEADRAADAMVSGGQAAVSSIGGGAQRKVHRDAAPAAPAASRYALLVVPTGMAPVQLPFAGKVLPAILGTGMFEGASGDVRAHLSDFAQAWGPPFASNTTGVAGKIKHADCEWVVTLSSFMLQASHLGSGSMGSVSAQGAANVSSGNTTTRGHEIKGGMAVGDGSSSASAEHSSSSSSAQAQSSGHSSTSTTQAEAEFQDFRVVIGFHIKVTRTVKHDSTYVSPESMAGVRAMDTVTSMLSPASILLDTIDGSPERLKKAQQEMRETLPEGSSSGTAFVSVIGVIKAPTLACVKMG